MAPAEAVSDPAPLARQIQPEKLRVVGTAESAAAPAAAKPVALAAAAPSGAPAAPAAARLEGGSFTLVDAPRAEKALEPLGLGTRLGQRRTEELAGWWVFIAPQAGAANARAAAQKKAAELKALKVY